MTAITRGGAPVWPITPGWQLGLAARAVDPVSGAAVVGATAARVLAKSEVVMGQRTAIRLRAEVGDIVQFKGWNGTTGHIRRVGYIGTTAEVGDTELTFSSSDAATFGFVTSGTVVMYGVVGRETALARVKGMLPGGLVTADPSWRPTGRDTELSTARLKELLGEFEYTAASSSSDPDSLTQQPGWAAANLVSRDLPLIGPMSCHKAVIGHLAGALAEIQSAGLGRYIDRADTRRYGGCYNPRFIRGTKAQGAPVSRHAYAAAIDINPSTNPFGGTPTMNLGVVSIFRKWGFAWGGTWVRKDGNHFEWIGGPGNNPLG